MSTGLFYIPGNTHANAYWRQQQRHSATWTPQQEATFCEALADGASLSAAAVLVGKSKGAACSKLEKIKRKLGWQAA
jgi:hypothetical protein